MTASVVGKLFGASGGGVHHPPWLTPIAGPSFVALSVVILVGGLTGPRLSKLPGAALLLPMVVATVLQDLGLLRIELPQPLLVISYVIVGWAIGLRFTRDAFREAARSLPAVLGSMAVLIAGCAAIGWALTLIGHLDMLTAYFATSPGGADSIAIITAGTSVDVPLVMAIQVGRFVAVLLLGPALARRAAQLAGAFQEPTGEST